jgi:hypothetical protein
MDWQPINTAPLNRNVEIAISDGTGVHAVACACRLTERGWIAAESKRAFYWVRPTHWRDWPATEKSIETEQRAAFPLAPLF